LAAPGGTSNSLGTAALRVALRVLCDATSCAARRRVRAVGDVGAMAVVDSLGYLGDK